MFRENEQASKYKTMSAIDEYRYKGIFLYYSFKFSTDLKIFKIKVWGKIN